MQKTDLEDFLNTGIVCQSGFLTRLLLRMKAGHIVSERILLELCWESLCLIKQELLARAEESKSSNVS